VSRRLLDRIRLTVICGVLTALVFLQQPGLVVPDTKSDLAFAPGRFLSRALHLWEPLGQFGQLQNQAYGYLFPMGPFFWLGEAAGLPAWAVQRLWVSVVVCAAFLGATLLARALGVRTFAAIVVAGLAYALSPRVLALIGSISIEAWPTALAPWVLLPLVRASASGQRRQAAALSALVVLLMGGVNAAATLAALLPAGVWLLVRAGTGAGRRLLAWWLGGVVLACAWWAVPLVLLGRYSPPFVDWVEDAGVTTRTTSLIEVLRGTSHWVGKLATGNGPVWPSAFEANTDRVLVTATVVTLLLGLAGLSSRAMPARRELVLMLLVGAAAVTAGYVGPATGWQAPAVRELLDGALAPLRNVHKFDPAVRLPLVLGLAHLADVARPRLARAGRRPWSRERLRQVVVGLVLVPLVVLALPSARGGTFYGRGVTGIPDYWHQTADWLHSRPGRSLVYPGMSTGLYVWGSSRDEPLQYLDDVEWAERDQVPLSSAGNIRWLDAVQSRLDSGSGSAGLARSLARAGVTRIVVRNDADWSRSGAPRPAVVHQALARTPGLHRVRTFGPTVWALPETADLAVDRGLDRGYPAVEVFAVDDPAPQVRAVPVSNVVSVAGGPESELALDDAGLLGRDPASTATIVAGDPEAVDLPTRRGVLTDGMRRREVDMGTTRNNASVTLATDDPLRLDRPVRDYLPFNTEGHETVARYRGAAAVRASSSAADPGAFRQRQMAALPSAAVDGDPTTSWLSSASKTVGQWWELRLARPVPVDRLVVQLAGSSGGGSVSRVDISTAAGRTSAALSPGPQPQRLRAPSGRTRWVRLTATDTRPGGQDPFGLAEVDLDGIRVVRQLRMPPLGSSAVTAVVASADLGRLRSCVEVGPAQVCSPDLSGSGEDGSGLVRVFRTRQAQVLDLSGTVLPAPGASRFLGGGGLEARGDSVPADPAASAESAVDGLAGTAWLAGRGTGARLSLSWPGRRTVSGVRLTRDPGLAVSIPLTVTVRLGGRTYDAQVSGDVVRFPPTRADRLELTVTGVAVRRNARLTSGGTEPLPVGFSEVAVLTGAGELTGRDRSGQSFLQACGFGPPVVVDGFTFPTAVQGTIGDVVAGRRLRLLPCGDPVTLPAGTHELSVAPTAEFQPAGLAMVPRGWSLPDRPGRAVTVGSWQPTRRTVRVAPGPRSLLVVAENHNSGWQATLAGERLRPVRVDGWTQAFVLPAGRGGVVDLEFGPDRPYRLALLLLPLAALLLGLGALAGRERTGKHVSTLLGDRPSRWVVLLGGAVTLTFAGGAWGAAAFVVGGLAVLGWRRVYAGARPPYPAVVGLPVLVAGVLVVLHPWGTAEPALYGRAAQVSALLALSALAWVAASPEEPLVPLPRAAERSDAR
jgi:arabinofuranan 3-O-arabinosyltransferase